MPGGRATVFRSKTNLTAHNIIRTRNASVFATQPSFIWDDSCTWPKLSSNLLFESLFRLIKDKILFAQLPIDRSHLTPSRGRRTSSAYCSAMCHVFRTWLRITFVCFHARRIVGQIPNCLNFFEQLHNIYLSILSLQASFSSRLGGLHPLQASLQWQEAPGDQPAVITHPLSLHQHWFQISHVVGVHDAELIQWWIVDVHWIMRVYRVQYIRGYIKFDEGNLRRQACPPKTDFCFGGHFKRASLPK